MSVPTVGRIIHVQYPGLECEAAIVTGVDGTSDKSPITIYVDRFPRSGDKRSPVVQSIIRDPNSWHWPTDHNND